MKKIPLTKGKYTLVDDADFERLSQWKWCYVSSGYAMRRIYLGTDGGKERSRYVLMHREILGASDRKTEVDHINHDKLDNRRSNLRLCDSSQNGFNSSLRADNTTGVRGVYWFKPYQKWKASITCRGKEHHLGYFNDKTEAITERKRAEKTLYGEFANVNL